MEESPRNQSRISKRVKETKIYAKLQDVHKKIPYLQSIPGPAIMIVALLICVNIIVWAAIAIVLRFHTAFAPTAALAWTLGLRHALDADHISCIDLMTRRLIASGQRPVR